MHIRRRHRSAPKYTYTQGSEPTSAKKALNLTLLLTLAALCLFLSGAVMFLKTLSSQIAVSDASDIVIDKVNSAIADILASGDYDGDYFVSFEKNSSGEITAISSNMARINALSAQILDRVVGAATDTHTLTIKIPSGNLTGISLLMGRGPSVPVQIIVLTSSRVEFSNSIVTAGINQTKHQILLDVDVRVSILLPGITTYTKVSNEISVAETVIVGGVPQTYTYFSTTEDKIEDYADEYIMNNG